MTTNRIPSPAEVRLLIDSRRDAQAEGLMSKCVDAINRMTSSSCTVQVPSGTEEWVVAHVIEQLTNAGWAAKRWLGDQRDPTNEIHISIP